MSFTEQCLSVIELNINPEKTKIIPSSTSFNPLNPVGVLCRRYCQQQQMPKLIRISFLQAEGIKPVKLKLYCKVKTLQAQ